MIEQLYAPDTLLSGKLPTFSKSEVLNINKNICLDILKFEFYAILYYISQLQKTTKIILLQLINLWKNSNFRKLDGNFEASPTVIQ
jgi:hypothetical protein